jgi:hypothetical protein
VSRRRLYGSGLSIDDQVVALDHRHHELRLASEAVVDAFAAVTAARYNNEARRAAAVAEQRVLELAEVLGHQVDALAAREARRG